VKVTLFPILRNNDYLKNFVLGFIRIKELEEEIRKTKEINNKENKKKK